MSKGLLLFVQLLWIVLLVGGIGFLMRSPERAQAPETYRSNAGSGDERRSPHAPGDRITLTATAVGCVWEVQEKVRDYAVAKDPEAVKRLWMAGVLTGKCETFSKGDEVIVVERPSAEEVYDERNDRDNQKNVNQAARDMECNPTEDPCDK